MVFLSQIKKFENLETDEERIKAAKDVYDQFIMKELLSQSHVIHDLYLHVAFSNSRLTFSNILN